MPPLGLAHKISCMMFCAPSSPICLLDANTQGDVGNHLLKIPEPPSEMGEPPYHDWIDK